MKSETLLKCRVMYCLSPLWYLWHTSSTRYCCLVFLSVAFTYAGDTARLNTLDVNQVVPDAYCFKNGTPSSRSSQWSELLFLCSRLHVNNESTRSNSLSSPSSSYPFSSSKLQKAAVISASSSHNICRPIPSSIPITVPSKDSLASFPAALTHSYYFRELRSVPV